MNSAVAAFLTCLLVLCAQGQPASRSSKCKCANSFVGRVSRQLIKAEPVIFQPSIFCPHTEIIITLKDDRQKCVNPQSPLGKLILRNNNNNNNNSNRQGKTGAVSTTTASGQTSTGSSTRVHSTSKL